MRTANLFGGENSVQYNAMNQAIKDCEEASCEHDFHSLPTTTMTAYLVDKLIENGFEIKIGRPQ